MKLIFAYLVLIIFGLLMSYGMGYTFLKDVVGNPVEKYKALLVILTGVGVICAMIVVPALLLWSFITVIGG